MASHPAPPSTANATATATWSCTSISGTSMLFKEGTPLHVLPAGSSGVMAWIDDYYREVDQSCISNAGKQWWHLEIEDGYVYDGYRIG